MTGPYLAEPLGLDEIAFKGAGWRLHALKRERHFLDQAGMARVLKPVPAYEAYNASLSCCGAIGLIRIL